MNEPLMLDPGQVARLAGLTRKQLLERCRCGRGPRLYRLGQRTVRFLKNDVADWLESRVEPDERKQA